VGVGGLGWGYPADLPLINPEFGALFGSH